MRSAVTFDNTKDMERLLVPGSGQIELLIGHFFAGWSKTGGWIIRIMRIMRIIPPPAATGHWSAHGAAWQALFADNSCDKPVNVVRRSE